MSDYAEIYRGANGDWYARRKAGNHETVSSSEGYTRKAGALDWAEHQDLIVRLVQDERDPGDETPEAA